MVVSYRMRHPGRHDYSPIENRRNSDASTGSSVEMEAMGPSTTTTTTTTAPTRAMVNIPAVGQADLTVPGIQVRITCLSVSCQWSFQSRSDTSPTSAESGDGPARFVIIGGAGSMNQFGNIPILSLSYCVYRHVTNGWPMGLRTRAQ